MTVQAEVVDVVVFVPTTIALAEQTFEPPIDIAPSTVFAPTPIEIAPLPNELPAIVLGPMAIAFLSTPWSDPLALAQNPIATFAPPSLNAEERGEQAKVPITTAPGLLPAEHAASPMTTPLHPAAFATLPIAILHNLLVVAVSPITILKLAPAPKQALFPKAIP